MVAAGAISKMCRPNLVRERSYPATGNTDSAMYYFDVIEYSCFVRYNFSLVVATNLKPQFVPVMACHQDILQCDKGQSLDTESPRCHEEYLLTDPDKVAMC